MQDQTIRPFNQKIRLYAFRAGLLVLLPILVLAMPVYEEDGALIEVLEFVGFLLLIAGVLGRLWATLYVGGRKNREVVTDGPYSMTRNPLYFFSTLAVLGAMLMFGMLTLALGLTLVVAIVMLLTARREQAFLEAEFGPAYRVYASRVPIFFPNPTLFRTAPMIEVSTRTLLRNLRDAAIFLLTFPIYELRDVLREQADLPFFFLF